jgi:cytochrome c oxidase assembly protein Cox11
MTRIDFKKMTIGQLVERFVTIALEQDEAELQGDTHKFRPLYWKMESVEEELKARPGDQRRALLSLYDHPNAQVRVKAAKATLAVAPQEAMRALERLSESHEYPQSGEAGMSLWNLDRGIFKPS